MKLLTFWTSDYRMRSFVFLMIVLQCRFTRLSKKPMKPNLLTIILMVNQFKLVESRIDGIFIGMTNIGRERRALYRRYLISHESTPRNIGK
mgnify:FL=1